MHGSPDRLLCTSWAAAPNPLGSICGQQVQAGQRPWGRCCLGPHDNAHITVAATPQIWGRMIVSQPPLLRMLDRSPAPTVKPPPNALSRARAPPLTAHRTRHTYMSPSPPPPPQIPALHLYHRLGWSTVKVFKVPDVLGYKFYSFHYLEREVDPKVDRGLA